MTPAEIAQVRCLISDCRQRLDHELGSMLVMLDRAERAWRASQQQARSCSPPDQLVRTDAHANG